MTTILHAIAGYFVLLLVVRVLAGRAGAQMTQFEYVIVFLIGGVIILSTVGNDKSVTNCTSAVIAVGLMHRTMSWLKLRSPMLGRLLDGTPLVVIRKGEWQSEVVAGKRLRQEDIEAAVRSANVTSVDKVDYAILERNGRVSIFAKDTSADG